MNKCLRCKKPLKRHSHHNRKRCEPCVKILRKRPQGTMSQRQIARATAMAGTMDRRDIAKKLGVSLSNLKRSCRGVKFNFHNRYAANRDLVLEVSKYYEVFGRRKTQERFPQVSVRSIIERYKLHGPRQLRWTQKERVELAKMAGIISFSDQAKYFNRPRASAGSIRSVYQKSIKLKGSELNGMIFNSCKLLIKPSCPLISRRLNTRSGDKTDSPKQRIALWVDMERHLRVDIPEVIKKTISDLATYQRWLFGATSNAHAKLKIMRMIKERTSGE